MDRRISAALELIHANVHARISIAELARLGFGACSLEVAVPAESEITGVEMLRGARVATSFPRLARELLPDPIEIADVHGSVELAPRLGLADAIVDLVSSGSTLRTNGLRSVATLLESEAVLVGPPNFRPFGSVTATVTGVVPLIDVMPAGICVSASARLSAPPFAPSNVAFAPNHATVNRLAATLPMSSRNASVRPRTSGNVICLLAAQSAAAWSSS